MDIVKYLEEIRIGDICKIYRYYTETDTFIEINK